MSIDSSQVADVTRDLTGASDAEWGAMVERFDAEVSPVVPEPDTAVREEVGLHYLAAVLEQVYGEDGSWEDMARAALTSRPTATAPEEQWPPDVPTDRGDDGKLARIRELTELSREHGIRSVAVDELLLILDDDREVDGLRVRTEALIKHAADNAVRTVRAIRRALDGEGGEQRG